MYVTPYIFFNGKCAEALAYYEKILGARVMARMTYGESPAREHVAKDLHDKVIHAAMMIGNTVVMAADDCTPDHAAGPSGGYSLTISVDTPEVARRLFDGLADGGTVTMALDKTFFADAFGSVHDRYDIRWMIIAEKAH
jgi:PhnB protein